MDQQISLPDKSNLVKEGTEALTEAKKYVCRTPAEYESCAVFFKWVKARQKEIKEDLAKDLEPKIKLLHQMHKDAVALREKVLAPYNGAENIIEGIMRPYILQKKQAEDAERRRKEAEAQKAAEEEKELLALQAEIEGRTEESQIINQLPAVAAPVQVESSVPKTEGMEIRRPWKWRITDLDAISDVYWVLNEKLINETVRLNKGETKISGIEVFQDVSIAG